MAKHVPANALRHYYVAFVITGLILVLAAVWSGPSALLPLIALAVIEITFSFDNAVINSHVLAQMNGFWRMMFLTVGIAFAVFGVRLVLPLLLVSGTTGHTIGHVLDVALHQPDRYAEELHAAYPIIAAFGSVFLLMIGLRFFGEKREVYWLDNVEAPLGEFNQPWWISILGACIAIASLYWFIAPGRRQVALAAVAGALTFVSIKAVSALLIRRSVDDDTKHNSSGLALFLYLELLDASFSFDGVIAAFAITKKVLLIAAGLGVGALYVRSITVHLLKANTLTHYRYLVHGAHYAILALACLLLASIRIAIPEMLTGVLGLVIIGAAFQSSRRHNQRAA